MNISNLKVAIQAAYARKQPVMIWGDPGVGKSSAVKQAANDSKVELLDLRLSLLEPVDLRGYLSSHNGVGKWIASPLLPVKGKGYLFLDELVQSTPSMQGCASQLILDRRIGEYRLPDGWCVIAAGNKASNRAATHAMPTHIANRFIHLNVEVDVPAWITWALAANIDIRIVAFIKWQSTMLHAFDPQAKTLAFPSPRSWEFVSNMLAAGLPAEVLHDFIKGAVGDGAAAAFIAFMQVCDKLPSIDSIMLNPSTAVIPTEMSVLYAVVSSLATRASADNIGKIATYFNRITDESARPEFSILAMKAISAADSSRTKKICNTRAFIEWSSKHAHVIA